MRKLNSVLPVALTANTFEWYEFAITGFMALEIGRLFFPAAGDKTALMLSFSVFAASYLTRPIGSVFFGLWGNKRGAGAAMKLSMILMAIPAALIAFLPTYQMVGYWATGLLLALKILHGFAAGGELPMSGYYVSMNTAGKNRGLYCSLVTTSAQFGVLLASLVVFVVPFLLSTLSSFFPSGVMGTRLGESWRWPFLFSIPLSLWILSIRASIPAGVTDRSLVKSGLHKRPLAPLLQAAALVAFMEMHFYTVFVWLPSYLHSYLGVSLSDARETNVIALIALAVSVLCTGYVTRWINPAKLVLVAVGSLLLSSYPLFVALQGAEFFSLILVQLAFAVMAGVLSGVMFLLLSDLFKDNWRSLGMTVGFTVPTAIFGGTAPVVCGYLIERTQLLTAPALYIIAMGLLAAPIAYYLSFKGRARQPRESMVV